MKKGFTLIELLAVLAIIAIVAIITTPIISNVLANSRENTFKNSVQEIVNIVKMDYNEYGRVGTVNYEFKNEKLVCKQCNNGSDLELDYTGSLEASGIITNVNGTITLNISNSKYSATYNSNKVNIIKKQ